jgi:hypothetical protein
VIALCRARRWAQNLALSDRRICGVGSLFISPGPGRPGSRVGIRHLALSGSVANTLLAMPGSFRMGWLIARVHRGSRTPAPVLSFLIVTWCSAIPTVSRQFSNALSDPRFHPYLAIQLMGICAFSLSVTAGGLWRKGNTT